MLQGAEKASSVGSWRKLDNVSQDNGSCMSSRGGGGRCVGRGLGGGVGGVRAYVRVRPPLLVQTLGAPTIGTAGVIAIRTGLNDRSQV